MSASDVQVGGNHYKKLGTQPWDVYGQWLGAEGFRGFLVGSCIKYLVRFKDKGGVEDLKKARHFLDKLIESETETTQVPEAQTTFPDRSDMRSPPLRCVCYEYSISDPARECPIHPFLIRTYP